MVQALEPLQNMANFDELVSITNEHNETLAHFAVMFGYPKLLRRLIEWDIDLTISDPPPLRLPRREGRHRALERWSTRKHLGRPWANSRGFDA